MKKARRTSLRSASAGIGQGWRLRGITGGVQQSLVVGGLSVLRGLAGFFLLERRDLEAGRVGDDDPDQMTRLGSFGHRIAADDLDHPAKSATRGGTVPCASVG